MARDNRNADEFLLLGRDEAVRRHLDTINLRVGRRLLVLLGAAALLYAIAFASSSRPVAAVLALAELTTIFILLRPSCGGFLQRRIRHVMMTVLIGHLAFLLVVHGPLQEGFRVWAFLLPLALLFLRFETSEYLLVQITFFVVSVFGAFVVSVFSGSEAGLATALRATGFIGYGVDHAVVLLLATRFTKRARQRFLEYWSTEVERNRERLRMKQELEHAREIQLSMLPRTGPDTGWLDIASLSLPATEVGGDYYDYFPIDDERLAVVVGDVAGHGVASGLVLSGVRSGLNLLERELTSPAAVMSRLNRMVVKTSPRRMIVALMVALFDRARRTVTVAAAGHPPLLIWRAADGTVEEVTRGSLPLGVRPDVEFDERVAALRDGDVLLLFTDGIAETLGHSGELYGYERLAVRLGSAAEEASARHVRDAILRDLWEFKGTTEQVDDVTMVVVKVRSVSQRSTA